MPTPVNTARQCLTPEAGQALDEAVAVARRRSHSQTSSLHVISALLSSPSSPLREACGRARNSAYSSRVQFKALELCLGVSLDRLPSTPQRVDEPPVSNSLMAAIKRSQASQRRQPENFHLYQQTASCSPSFASVSTIKVELQNLILSILDDPIVSRVFGESGFRNSDIKLSVLRPVHHQLLRYRGPPVFLCNLTDNFSFPFHGFSENDENCKRIIEILVRKHGKKRNNPLLVGASAIDALNFFLETLQKRKDSAIFPPELCNLSVICIRDEIFNFVNGNYDMGFLRSRLEEVGHVLKQNLGPGVLVEFGDLKVLMAEKSSMDAVSFVVKKLASLLEVHGERLWLIGAAERHETYLEFLKKFPCVENDWDLHLLPINSIRPPMAETFPKSSLMESFVPFGGFFSMPSDIKSPLSGLNDYGTRCNLCNEKCKYEVNAISKGLLTSSVSDQYQSSLPSWLQISQLCTKGKLDSPKAQDDSIVLNAKVVGLQKKWDSICHRLHQPEPYARMLPLATYKVASQIPSVVGFHMVEGSINMTTNASSNECQCNTKSKSKLSASSVGDDLTSLMSANSVTTDLELGVNHSSGTDTVKSSSSFPVHHKQFDHKDYKLLYSSIFTRVRRQEDAIAIVSQTIANCRTRNKSQRSTIWFGFLGPDRIAKKEIALALAQVLYGDKENIIRVDLSCQNLIDGCELKLRGKNIVDFIADELHTKPLSVAFLENVEMADTLTQEHLSRAISTGRFSDSHGREVSISNAIFVLTSNLNYPKENMNYPEENVHITKSQRNNPQIFRNKRKLFLDLNMPAEENGTNYDSTPENPKLDSWLKGFLEQVDEKVIFKPFDFDQLSPS